MRLCPNCNERLTSEELVSGRCTHCGGEVNASNLESLSLPDINELLALQQTSTVAPTSVPSSGPAELAGTRTPTDTRRQSSTEMLDMPETSPTAKPDEQTENGPTQAVRSSHGGDSMELPSVHVGSGGEAPSESTQRMPSGGGGSFDPSMQETKKDPLDGGDPYSTMDSGLYADAAKPLIIAAADTIRAEDLAGDRTQKNVTRMWGNAVPDGAKPHMTLKGNEAETQTATQTATRISLRPRLLKPRMQVVGSVEGSGADYELLDVLGEGGMGVVYTARQTTIDRTIAIKMLKPAMARDEVARSKFLSEAAVTGDLDHPNIVPVHDLGVNDDGALFYAMKCVRGKPWLKVLPDKSITENVEILMRVADAMAFAHSRGIIHRDLKPENVMLGDYGEVLVMDWGLAASVGHDSKASRLSNAETVGGTPCYMAPEMAAGPMNRVGPRSDIYLLGAMLYELITGDPPHDGANVMMCLFAAARNEIVPTDKKGELVDIALKAMATLPEDRYATVQEFQAAIRDYQSHSESILLSTAAQQEFQAAEASKSYDRYAQALYGFRQALNLWDKNKAARDGVARVQLAYATAAYGAGDLDLAMSLLQDDIASHQEFKPQVLRARDERIARQNRVRTLSIAAQALVVLVLATVTVAYFWIRSAYEQAVISERRATDASIEAQKQFLGAEAARKSEEIQKLAAEKAKDEAQTNFRLAEESRKQEAAAREKEAAAREQEAKARALAEEQKAKAEAAEKLAVQEGYIAKIGLAAAKIVANSFDQAQGLLQATPPPLRGWEWGRLAFLFDRDAGTYAGHEMRVDALAIHPKANQIITGSWDGRAILWDVEAKLPLRTFPHDAHVRAVAISPDGTRVATGGDDCVIKVWDLATAKLIKEIPGHDEPILTLAYNRDGQKLLSGSADYTARLWNATTGEIIMAFAAHTWRVWSAKFSPDEKRVVTASDDGTVLVWRATIAANKDEEGFLPILPLGAAALKLPRAMLINRCQLHTGAVYTASFTPDGQSVISAGFDQMVRIWRPLPNRPEVSAVEREWLAHEGAIRHVELSADGKWLATCGNDNVVRLWDFAGNKPIQTYRGHSAAVSQVVFSKDAKFLFSSSEDRLAKRWDRIGYAEQYDLDGHADFVLAASFSPDQKLVATGSRDQSARLWDASNGQPLRTLSEAHSKAILCAVVSPVGQIAATGSEDDTVRLWNTGTGQLLGTLPGHQDYVLALAFSPNGKLLISGDGAGKVRLWDVEKATLVRTFTQHIKPVTALCFSPDNQSFVSGDADGLALVFAIDGAKAKALYRKHGALLSALKYSPDGTLVYSGSKDASVGIWNAQTGAEVRVLAHNRTRMNIIEEVVAMDLTPDGTKLVTGANDSNVRVWNTADGKLLATFPCQNPPTAITITPDGNTAIGCDLSESVYEWDLQKLVARPSISPTQSPLYGVVAAADGKHWLLSDSLQIFWWDVSASKIKLSLGGQGNIFGVGFTPDSQEAITVGYDRSIRVWDAASGKSTRHFAGAHDGPINSLDVWPKRPTDGATTLVLTSSDDMTARLRRYDTFELLQVLKGHTHIVRSAVFSPNGKLAATASIDDTARIWDLATGETLKVLKGHDWWVHAVAFSPDGQRVATGSEDNSVKIWSVQSGECLATLQGHTGAVVSVAFSPDGRRLLSGSVDSRAKLWDLDRYTEVLALERHRQEVTVVRFSPDGLVALTGSRDERAILWPAAPWSQPVEAAEGME